MFYTFSFGLKHGNTLMMSRDLCISLKHQTVVQIDNTKQRIYIFHDFVNISVCESHEFLCTSGIQCVDSLAVCDGIPHCMDGTDEIACCKLCS